MNDLTTTAIESEFHDKLINQFFHPKSYFVHCVKGYLANPLRLTNQPQLAILPVIARLIDYLTKAKMPLQDLQEIAQIKGFETLLGALNSSLSKYDFKFISPSHIRGTIEEIASHFLQELYQILVINEKGRTALVAYLNIKSKLAELFRNSNGRNKSVPTLNSLQDLVSSDIVLPATNKVQLRESKKTEDKGPSADVSFNAHREDGRFEQQLRRLLELIIELRMNITFDADFMLMRSIEARFAQIKHLADNYGAEIISSIAGHLVQLLHTSLTKLRPADQPMVDIIDMALRLIGQPPDQQDEPGELSRFFGHCDQLMKVIEQSDKAAVAANDQANASTGYVHDEPDCFEINTRLPDNGEGLKKSVPSDHGGSIFSGFHINQTSSMRDVEPKEMEDDETILKLSYHIKPNADGSSAEANIRIENGLKSRVARPNNLIKTEPDSILRHEHSADAPAVSQMPPVSDVSEPNDAPANGLRMNGSPDKRDEHALMPLFHQEADWYFKVLFAALKQLKNQEKIQAALEDIELASSSLKRLARKFGIDEVDRLPELIEMISIFANQHIIKLPQPIIQTIEDGVALLKEFDRNDPQQRHQLDALIAKLDEFSSSTMKRLPKN